ncbi:MAG TPA: phosphoribosylformylglycinamidine cyclo-ligase, partial [Candidatus Mailhella excrementigallinarum]|nr:phosphoribosylformylglycinamidine cyclo-ligase [Candidatus Mailhella excrementigallinarum]
MSSSRSQAYTDAGVNINAGNELVSRIKSLVASTRIPGVVSDIGGFGGLFRPELEGMKTPVLVSSTDGVGTKLKLAALFDRHDTVGIDLVAMSVNDILVQGAKPLFFLDYFATGELNVEQAEAVVGGVAEGCRRGGCALLGGETAEMPGMYAGGDYDLAGFCVGIADLGDIVDGSGIIPGDVVLGLASSGVHSNGYTLVRKLFEASGASADDIFPGTNRSFREVLLEPTIIYTRILEKLLQNTRAKGMVHVTGGGFYDNIPRVLPQNVCARIDFGVWDMPPVFEWLKEQGRLSWPEMLQIFNCGIGYI